MQRREFLKGLSAGAAGAALYGYPALGRTVRRAASDQVNVGVIGAGSRGQWVMKHLLQLPGVKVVAVADVYEPRFEAVRRLTGEQTPAYTDYRRMLDAHRMDAVLVATPLNLHAEHVTASLDRGLHVYGEKSMGFTVEHCDRIVEAARRAKGFFQVGHQYRYAPWYHEAVRRIEAGEIGRITHIYAYWHRNYNWRRPVPDPSLERLINWRLYREFSGGLLAELGSHHIDLANWVFRSHPASVIGNGGIDFYPDGREIHDNVQAIYNYPNGGKLFFSSILGNHKTGFQIQLFGTGGTAELTLEDGFFFYEPARKNSAVPEELIEAGVHTSATLTTRGDMPYRGEGSKIEAPEEGSPDFRCAGSFIQSIRENQRPFADELVGWRAAVAVALGNKAVLEGGRVEFADHARLPEPPAN